MDNVRKKREGEDALAVSRLFDAYIKKTLKNNVKTARDARDRRNRVLLLPLEYLDEMAAPPYICKEEQTKVFLGDTMLYLDDEKLAEVIDCLAERYKRILELSIIHRYSERETAEMMNLSTHSVHQYKHDALRFMEKELKGGGYEQQS